MFQRPMQRCYDAASGVASFQQRRGQCLDDPDHRHRGSSVEMRSPRRPASSRVARDQRRACSRRPWRLSEVSHRCSSCCSPAAAMERSISSLQLPARSTSLASRGCCTTSPHEGSSRARGPSGPSHIRSGTRFLCSRCTGSRGAGFIPRPRPGTTPTTHRCIPFRVGRAHEPMVSPQSRQCPPGHAREGNGSRAAFADARLSSPGV